MKYSEINQGSLVLTFNIRFITATFNPEVSENNSNKKVFDVDWAIETIWQIVSHLEKLDWILLLKSAVSVIAPFYLCWLELKLHKYFTSMLHYCTENLICHHNCSVLHKPGT